MSDTTSGGESDPLMAIGMFSRASLVSVKALRSYHEMGLLVPAQVDATTGYRSYRVSQLPDAALIRRLRSLDMSLADIGEVLRARDPDVTRSIVEEHERAMQARLDEVHRIVDELQLALDRPSLQTPIHVRDEAATHALSFSGTVDDNDYGPFLDHAYQQLFAAVDLVGARPAGATAARYPIDVDTDREPVEAYLPIAEPVPVPAPVQATGVVLDLIPPATCAVATHVGGYDTIGDTYLQLGAWVARHATSAQQPVREHYVVSVDPETFELLPPEQRRTEICWPIVPDAGDVTPSTRTTPRASGARS